MPKQPYFFHPWIDALFAGALSLIGLLVFFKLESPETSAWALHWSIILLWFINWPHFSATLYRLYHSKAQALQYPWTAFLSPFVFLALGLVILTSSGPAASVPVHLYALWAPFHFSAQSIGISFIYARRSGIQLSLWERRAFIGFCHSSFFYMMAQVESQSTLQRFGAVSYPTLGLPAWVVPMTGAVFFASTLFWVWTLWRWRQREGSFFPWISLLPIATQVTWFTAGPYSPSFNQLVPMFHSLQYLPIVWWMQMKEQGPSWRESFRWARTNFLGGALLFWGAPAFLSVLGFNLELARVAVFTAINLHHFYIDGVIWKLRNSKVSVPLLGQLRTN